MKFIFSETALKLLFIQILKARLKLCLSKVTNVEQHFWQFEIVIYFTRKGLFEMVIS